MTTKEIILHQKKIQDRVFELAQEISHDYQGKNLVLIGILNGAFIFMADLVRAVSIPLKIDFIRVASYGLTTTSSGSIHFISSPTSFSVYDSF